MEDKARKLVLALEMLALVTAAILILVDYKLKRDLEDLFARIRDATGIRVANPDASRRPNPDRIRASAVMGDAARVETASADSPIPTGSKTRTAKRRTSADSGGRIADTPFPATDQ